MKKYKVIKLITPWKLSIQLKYMPLLAANTDNIRYGKANIYTLVSCPVWYFYLCHFKWLCCFMECLELISELPIDR